MSGELSSLPVVHGRMSGIAVFVNPNSLSGYRVMIMQHAFEVNF
jgi:hypothetical protein